MQCHLIFLQEGSRRLQTRARAQARRYMPGSLSWGPLVGQLAFLALVLNSGSLVVWVVTQAQLNGSGFEYY